MTRATPHNATAVHARTSVVQDAFEECKAVTRQRARNFYYGLKLAPEPKRSALFAVYAWMRTGDDIADADEPETTRREKLHAFRDQTEQLLSTNAAPVSEPMWVALAHTLNEFPIDHADIRAMLDGLEDDLSVNKVIATEAEADRYCDCVAATVGRVCIAIWGVRAGADETLARELATKRGLAFQQTNMLRDFVEDFDAGRIYLPADAFERAGLTAEELRHWRKPRVCAAFVRDRAARARAHYDASAPLDQLIEADSRSALWAMTRIYSRLLEKIENAPQRIIDRRIRVRSIHKAGIAFRAALMTRGEAKRS